MELSEIESVLSGRDIPLRQLTEEELRVPVTYDRFQDLHYDIGEDFCDQFENVIAIGTFSGFAVAKYPEYAKRIWAKINGKRAIAQDILHIFIDDRGSETGHEDFYTMLAEYINTTEKTLARVNAIMILIGEYYND